jgi:hypothetical protein
MVTKLMFIIPDLIVPVICALSNHQGTKINKQVCGSQVFASGKACILTKRVLSNDGKGIRDFGIPFPLIVHSC